jgi:hypothetical protein
MSRTESHPADLAGRLARLTPAQRQLLRSRVGGSLGGRLPLTRAQVGIWFFEQLEPGTAAYNNPAGLRLRGPLDVEALRATLALLQERHEALRVRYDDDDGQPFGVVEARPALPLEIIDASGSEAPESEALELAARAAHEPFDLAAGPLWRILLVRVGVDDHVLVVTVHHIASDGWSLGVLLRDLRLCYASLRRGVSPALPPLAARLADIVRADERALENERDELVAYWRERLAHFPQHVELPYDTPETPTTYRGAAVGLTLGVELTKALEARCAAEAGTLFAGLVGIFTALLHSYSGQTHLVVTTPVAGRHDPRSHDLVGCFLNTVPLALVLDPDAPLRALVHRARDALAESLPRSRLPFADLVAALTGTRASRERPISNVMVLQNNAPLDALELPDLDVTRIRLPLVSVKQDWAVIAARTAAGVEADLEYTVDRFAEQTIRRAVARFSTLAEWLAARPELPLAQAVAGLA